MLASEVIAALQALVERHGDLELRVPIGGDDYGGTYTPDPPKYVPARTWAWETSTDLEHFYMAP